MNLSIIEEWRCSWRKADAMWFLFLFLQHNRDHLGCPLQRDEYSMFCFSSRFTRSENRAFSMHYLLLSTPYYVVLYYFFSK
jgi:hypothetical protein